MEEGKGNLGIEHRFNLLNIFQLDSSFQSLAYRASNSSNHISLFYYFCSVFDGIDALMHTKTCDKLNETCSPLSPALECLAPPWWHCLERLRGRGGILSLGVGFES